MPSKRSRESTQNEIANLLADLSNRQQEIVERGRSENYLFVLLFTALGGVIAAIAALESSPASKDQSLSEFLPTLVLLASLTLLALPVDLVHLGYGSEIRRVYIQRVLEPRLKDLIPRRWRDSHGKLVSAFDFERFDRDLHWGWFDILIGFRSFFVWLPSAILLGYYFFLRNHTAAGVWSARFEIALFVIGGATMVAMGGAFVKMFLMIRAERKK